MFEFSLVELFFFLIIALVILGPNELSKILISMRKNYFQLKSMLHKIQDEIESEIEIKKLRDHINLPLVLTEDINEKIKENLINYDKEIVIKNVFSKRNNYIIFYPCKKYSLKPYSIYYISNFYFKI